MSRLTPILLAFAKGIAATIGALGAAASIYWGMTGDSPAELLVNLTTTVRVVAESPLDTLDVTALNEIVQRCLALPECP